MANTIDDLKEQALTIKNASQTGENTANRVGTLFYDIVDNLIVGKYEFRYKNSKVKPTKPADGSDGTTGGWAKEPTAPHYDEGELTWMTQCYYSYANGYGKWSTPIRITGANGKDGEDGKDVEFVYTRNNTGKTLNPPIYDDAGNPVDKTDDWTGYDQDGIFWTDNPQGVEEDHMYEYVCVRTKEAGAARWNAFSEPSIWSKWGQKGKDGDGYEYIFFTTVDENTVPNINYDTWFDPRTQTYKTKNDDEYLPYSTDGTYSTRWSDDPNGVSETSKIEWVSVRKKINGVWGDFAEPKVWSKYAKDGTSGARYEVRYKNYIPTEEVPIPAKPTGDGRSDGWTDNPTDPDIEHGECTFISQAYYQEGEEGSTGTYGEWTNPIRITGPQGLPGEDGADIEFIYTRINDLQFAPAAPEYDADHNPINTQDDWKGIDDNGVIWTDNPKGVDPDDHRYEFISMRTRAKDSLVWEAFSVPALWSNWGKTGMDGDGIQYIFKLFPYELNDAERTDNVPTNATMNSKGEWMPSGTSGVNAGWYDNPPSATQNMPFCYCSIIRKIGGEWNKNGEYGKFEPLGYWTKWSKDGENAIKIDLDNEMDSILYDGTGTQKMSGNVTTNVYLYDGVEDVSDRTAFTISNREGMTEEQATITGRTITVNGLISDGVVTIQGEYPLNSGKYYYSKFTVKKLVGVDKFDLIVKPTAISVNTSETLTDTTITVQVYRTPANGGEREIINIDSHGLTLSVTTSAGTPLEPVGTGETTKTYNLVGSIAASIDYLTVLLTKATAIQDIETIPVNHVKNGKDGSGSSAIRIDLSNEMDSIPCDVDGYVMSKTILHTNARIYDGASPVVLTADNTEITIDKIAGVDASYSFIEGALDINWVIYNSAIVPLTQNKYTANITIKWNDNTYYATFIAAVVKSGEPGVSPTMYQLSPEPNTLAFKKDSEGKLPTSPITLNMKIKKSDGDGTGFISIAESGLTVMYSFDDMPDTPSEGKPFPVSGVPVSVSTNNVYVAAFKDTTLVDKETIPVIVDGIDSTVPGPQGPGGWMITPNPANVILTQGAGTNSSVFTKVEVSFSAKKGNDDGTHLYLTDLVGTNFSVSLYTEPGDEHATKVVVNSPTLDEQGNYHTEGNFTVVVHVVDPDTGDYVLFHNVTVPCIANLLGTWKEWVVGDTKTEVAESIEYAINGTTGQVDGYKALGEFKRSSTENTSILTKKVDNGKNLLSGVLTAAGWKSGNYPTFNNDAIVDDGDWIRVVRGDQHIKTPNITLEAGTYTFSLESNSSSGISGLICNSDGSQRGEIVLLGSDRKKVTFNTASQITVYIVLAADSIRYPQIEVGSTVTDFDADTIETSSRIKQTADEIEAKVNDTGVNIQDKRIDLFADKVRFYKNKAQATSGDEAKIWIDGDKGSLHAVDGEFEGLVRTVKEGKGAWEISPSEYEAFSSPVITGYDKNNNRVLYMIFDGDPDDPITIDKGGGLYFTNGTEGDISHYLREGWRVKCPDYNRMDEDGKADAITAVPGTRLIREPQIVVSSNYKKFGASGDYAAIKMSINTSVGGGGACIYSNDWKTKSYAAPGDTYVDDFGNLKVKGISSYDQINYVFNQSSCQLPAGVPVGTIFIVKLKDDGKVYSTCPILNSHDREKWDRDAQGNYYSNLYEASHFFVFDGTNWIDYFCSFQ